MRSIGKLFQGLYIILGVGLALFFAGLGIWLCVRIILA